MEHKREERPSRQTPARRPKKKKLRIGKIIGGIFGVLFTMLLIGICTGTLMASIFMKYVETNIIPVVQVNADDYTMQLSSHIYYQDKETQEWVEFQTIYGEENRVYAKLEEMPDALWQAVVAIEDERFFQHQGVDWKRTAGATVNMFIGMKNTFGGSTITQQLLKNMTEDNDPYVSRKVREIFRALEFEKNYTKEQILELYLNTIYLGKGCYGVKTAAQYYFGKELSELTTAECACLVAITNNPSMYGPMYDIKITERDENGKKIIKTPRQKNKERQELILDKMAEVGKDGTVEDGFTAFITEDECKAYKREVLQFTDGSTDADSIVAKATGGIKINSWFVDQIIRDVTRDLAAEYGITEKEARVKLYNSGLKVYTTLDPEIQEIAETVYMDRSNLDVTSRSGQPLQSGMTIVDPYTGHIVAMVGKVGAKEENLGWNYATGRRQVGSSIKPLTVYAPAFDMGVVTPATTFDDYPVQMMNETYWPKNSPNKYRGWTQVSVGIQNSINTIAVQTLQAVGVTDAFAFATENLNLGLVAEDMDISPLGMGGLTRGLNTMEMAAAYAAFANQGIYITPSTYVRVENASGEVILENEGESHVAMKETTAYLMNQMLKNAVSYGTGTSAKFSGMTIAGKTGTTSDNNDRYFVGYTPYYVAAVWTGYDQPEKISYDGNPAITMWKLVMEQIHAELENKDFVKPSSGLETVTVCKDSGLLCGDACHADLRGDRAVSVTVPEGGAPTETCTLHVFRSYCPEGQCLATEMCPFETTTQVGLLDHVRAEYFTVDEDSGERLGRVTAEDSSYVISDIERTMGLVPEIAEDGTEIYPEIIGCPVHNWYDPMSPWYPWDPWAPELDPSDPNYIPPVYVDPSGGFGDENWYPTGPEEPAEPESPVESETPTEPQVPSLEDDPTGGLGDAGDWWQNLMGNITV